MKIYDISWPISPSMTAYKNNKTVIFDKKKEFDPDKVRDSAITLGSHTGTHVDAPSHFLRDGTVIDQISLDRLIGKARVIDCVLVTNAIQPKDLLDQDIAEGDIILLRTANSASDPNGAFNPEFIYLSPQAAEFLAQKRVKAVGIDYLGIERGDPEHRTHTTLMHADIAIIEGLRLEHVPAGSYFMICLPLAIIGLEAAPARAILMTE